MRDVQTQLRNYFDEVVERVTDEDVRIRATTQRGIPLRSPRFRPGPLAAGAIGFGAAITLIGLVLVVDRVFGAGLADVARNTDVAGNGSTAPPSEPGSPWLFVPVLFGVGLLATGIISGRRRITRQGEGTMDTIERHEQREAPTDEVTRVMKRNRRLGWLAGILAVATIGLGAWLIAETASSEGVSMPSEVQAAMDDYYAAWNTGSRVDFLDATTTDYTFTSNGDVFDREPQAARVGALVYFDIEVLDRTISGDGPYYIGSAEIADLSPLADSPEYAGHSLMTVTQVDGVWKVSQHTWVGDI